ncbi:MAG: NUDIX domain-containing protein [Patescibacteria group bacterium]
MADFPNSVVTFLPVHDGSILLIKRPSHERHYPGKWAFPGGKVEHDETLVETLLRELEEETSLEPGGEICFLDSYKFGTSVGIAFGVKVTGKNITHFDGDEYVWIKTLKDMKRYDRIAGIDNHVAYLLEKLDKPECWSRIDRANLIPRIYINP